MFAALGDMAIEIDRMAGAILFFGYHMLAIALYVRHPRETLAASQQLAAANGAVDFTANATGSIFASAITPELQKLVAGQQTPEGYVKAVQAEYEKEMSR